MSVSPAPARSTAAPEVMFMRAERRVGSVPVFIKLGQGIGALTGQHKEWAFNTLLLLYYSQILGLPATNASIVLAVALIFDALADPIVGAWSDSFRSKWGRRHPFMFASIIPTSVTIYLLFSPPHGLSTELLTVWLLIFAVLMRFVFTFFLVPWHAVAAELSENYAERTSIITYRLVVGWVGGMAFVFAMYSWVFKGSAEYPNGMMDPSRYGVFAVVIGVLTFVWISVSSLITRTQVRYLPQPTASSPRTNAGDIARRILTALKNRNFRLIFFTVLISAAVSGTGQVFDIYMNLYYWELRPADIRWFSLAVFGVVGSFLTAGLLQRSFQKQNIMIGSLVAVTLLLMAKVLLRFTGIWPDNGDPMLIKLFVLHAGVTAYFSSMVLIMFASMVADIVDEQEYHTGLRQEGVFSAGITFAGKATTSLGLICGGLLLDMFIQFPRGSAPGSVGEDSLFRLALTDGILVPAANLIPFFLLLRYSLTRERLQQMQAELRARELK